MLKATERLHWLTPAKFDLMSRAGQSVVIVFAQERDLEDLERAGSLAVGNLLTKA